MGCHFLLQEIFPTQGLNPGLPHCRQTFYCLSHPVPRNFSTRAIFPTGSWLWEAQVESQASLSWFHGDLEALCSRDRDCETTADQRREKGSESVRCSVTSDSTHHGLQSAMLLCPCWGGEPFGFPGDLPN